METERTRDRRVLRERRLAYFDKPEKTPTTASRSPESPQLTNGSVGQQQGPKNGLTKSWQRGATNSITKHPRKAGNGRQGVDGGGHHGSLREGKPSQVEGPTSKFEGSDSGSLGVYPDINGGLCGGGSDTFRVHRNEGELRSGHRKSHAPVTQQDNIHYGGSQVNFVKDGGSRVKVDSSLDYDCFTSTKMEARRPRNGKVTSERHLETVTKTRNPSDAHRLEREHSDFPRPKNGGSDTRTSGTANSATREHNAFGIDSMLEEMRRVREVKSQLNREVRNSFEVCGSISGILSRMRHPHGRGVDSPHMVCDYTPASINEEERQSLDGSQGSPQHGGMDQSWRDEGIETGERPADYDEIGSGSACPGVVDDLMGRWCLTDDRMVDDIEERNGPNDCGTRVLSEEDSTEKTPNTPQFGVAKSQERGIGQVFSGGDSTAVSSRLDISAYGKGTSRHLGEGSCQASDDICLGDEEGTEGRPLVGSNATEDDFNLGALCAAAKQGDDILKEYIKRLTRKILDEKDDAGKGDGKSPFQSHSADGCCHGSHVGRGVGESVDSWQDQGTQVATGPRKQHLEESDRLKKGAPGQDIPSHQGELNLAQATSRTGMSTEIPTDQRLPMSDVNEAFYSSEELSRLRPSYEENLDLQKRGHLFDEVLSICSEEDARGSPPLVSTDQEITGFETHRPSSRAHSPLKVLAHPARKDLSGSEDLDSSPEREDDVDKESDDDPRETFPLPAWSRGVPSCLSDDKDLAQQIGPGSSGKQQRSPRTPEQHKMGVRRHHDHHGRRKEGELEEESRSNGEIFPQCNNGGDNLTVESLRLRLSLVESISGRRSPTLLSEVTLDEAESGREGSGRYIHDMERDSESRMEEDESLLMQRISNFDPSVLKERGSDRGIVGDELMSGMKKDVKDPNNNQRVSFFTEKRDLQHGISNEIMEDSLNGRSLPKQNMGQQNTLSPTVEGVKRNDSRNSKSRPKSAPHPKRGVSRSEDYRPRWPQSSNLIPTRRPGRGDPAPSSPERESGRKARPSSAKVLRQSTGNGSVGRRSRPGAASASKKSSKEPGPGGDFLKVRSSKVFDDNGLRAPASAPLTLQLISESPRECRSLSIWQLLPDEILLGIFSHLRQAELARCALVCRGFHRVAMDESLWRFIHMEKRKLTDYQLTQVGSKHPVTVRLIQCIGRTVTENGLRNLFRDCVHSLQELSISGCTGDMFSGDSVLLHASRCKNLTSVDASWCNVTDNGLNLLAPMGNRLSCLCLNGCQGITDAALRALIDVHGTSLKELELLGCINLSPSTLSRIGELCKNLRNLNIGQCYKITDECLYEVIPSLKALRHLDIRGCKQVRDDSVRRIARCCKSLETLVLANCSFISNISMVDIAANIKTLRCLDVSGCRKITNEGVRSVAMCCTGLEALNLSSTSIDRKSISSLASYCSQSLRELKLNCCKDVTEASIVKLLKHCRRLETLHLYGVKGLRNLGVLKLQYPCIMFE